MPSRIRTYLADLADDASSYASGPRGRRSLLRAARSWPAAVALVALCLAVYLPGIAALPVIDRDEARFAQASRQMFEAAALPEAERDAVLHGGGLLVPRVGGTDRLIKPPLIYYAQSASAAVFTGGDPARDAIWMYRVPSVLGATLAVLATWWVGVRMFDPRAAVLGAALLAVCPVVVFDANQARADQLYVGLTTCAMAALWACFKKPGLVAAVAFWAFVGLGTMAKGLTPMVAGLAVLALCVTTRRWSWVLGLRPLVGLAILAVIVLPWPIAVAARVGFGEYLSTVWDETVGRSGTAAEGHWGPPGYHLVLLPLLFWPGSLLTAIAAGRAIKRGFAAPVAGHPTDPPPGRVTRIKRFVVRNTIRRRPGRSAELFCLCSVVPAWVVWELVSTKLPHYVLPLYPPLALLSARAILAAASGVLASVRARSATLGYHLWFGIGVIVALGLPVAAAVMTWDWRWTAAASVVAAGGGWLLWRARGRLMLGLFARAQLWSIAAAALVPLALFELALPRVKGAWLSEAIHGAIAADVRTRFGDDAPPPRVGATEYHEDSLVFLTRGRLERLDDGAELGWISDARSADAPVYLVAPAEFESALEGSLARPASGTVRIATVSGFNYSRGKTQRLGVFRVGGRGGGGVGAQ